MPEPAVAIDIAPLETLAGAVLADEDQPPGLPERLLACLRAERIVAAVDTTVATEPTDVVVRFAVDDRGRIQRLDAQGRLGGGPRADELAAAVSAALGAEVALAWDDPEVLADLDDPAVAPDVAEDAGLADAELDDAEGITDAELGEDAELDPAEAFDASFLDIDLDDEPRRILLFSRRGPSLAALLAHRTGDRVETGQVGEWSVFRYLDTAYTDPPTPSRRELPSIQVVLTDDDDLTHGYVEVTTAVPGLRDLVRRARGGAGDLLGWLPGQAQHVLFPRENAGMRPVFAADELDDPRAAAVQTVLVDDARALTSSVHALAADRAFADAVDVPGLLRAMAPDGEGTPSPTRDRVRLLLTALGLPAELVEPALTGDAMPTAHVFDPTGVVGTALRLAQDGVAGTRPVGVPPGPWGRLDEAVRRRPSLAAAVAGAEAVAGGAILLAGLRLRRRARGRGAALAVLGAVLVADALVDAALVRRRLATERG